MGEMWMVLQLNDKDVLAVWGPFWTEDDATSYARKRAIDSINGWKAVPVSDPASTKGN